MGTWKCSWYVRRTRTIIPALRNLIDARLRTGEFTLITDSASLKITRSILRNEQQTVRERERRRLIIQRRVILPIRSNYSRRRIKERSFSACLFAPDLDTGTRPLVVQAVSRTKRSFGGGVRGGTEPFTSIRDASFKQQLQRPLFTTKLRCGGRGGGAINAQCRGHDRRNS